MIAMTAASPLERENSMDEELRQRILEEVALLHHQIHTCHHCESLRQQIVQLLGMLPPDPIRVSAEQALDWMRTAMREGA
jgi:hypothetical protein